MGFEYLYKDVVDSLPKWRPHQWRSSWENEDIKIKIKKSNRFCENMRGWGNM